MADTLLSFVRIYLPPFGYFTVMLGSLAEGLALPFPSVILVIMAGAAVAHGRMSFVNVVMGASLAYTMGALVPYVIGRNVARFKRHKWAISLTARAPLGQAQALFSRHGHKIVALSRPFFVGNWVSYIAGFAHMSPLKFVVYTFLGILPWAIAATSVGWLFGYNIPRAVAIFREYSALLGALGVLVIVVLFAWQKVKNRASRS